MLKNHSLAFVAIIAVLGVFVTHVQVQAADEAVKVSAFSPADDLTKQVDLYIKSMKDTVASEQEYKDSEDKIARESNTLVVIALALGLHDHDNKYKASAGDLMRAAQKVAATKDYVSAKGAVAALEKVASTNAKSGVTLKWEKVASLPELMKQVPMLHTKLKLKVTSGSDIKWKAKETVGYSAVIAAIAQATIADTSATKNAEQVKLWEKFSTAMRDKAGEVNTGIHIGNVEATGKAMKKLNKTCDDCHKVFKPDVVIDDKGK